MTLLVLFLSLFLPADTLSEWQDEILSRLDDETVDALGEEGMRQYMGLLEDLEFEQRASVARYSQEVTVHADACLSRREGYRNKTRERMLANKVYLGDALHGNVRWKASFGQWRAAVTADKDAGERYGNGTVMGFAEWRRNADCRVIVGDYRVCLGTGLILNQNFSLGKQLMQAAFFQHPTRLTGHSSTDEYRHLRGVASEWRWGRLRVLAFASARLMDGRVAGDTLRTLYSDGMHRTNAEVGYARQVWMWQGGGRAAWRGDWWEAGANVRTVAVDPVWYRSVQTYNRNWFRGRGLTSASLDWAAQWRGMKTRGEAAVDDRGGWAAQAAASVPMGEDWEAVLSGRWYSDDYRQVDGGGIAESSVMQAERGVMLAVSGQPWRHWKVGAWADRFWFTQPQYHIPQPSDGWDLGLRADYERKTWSLSAQYRAKLKSKTDASTADTRDMLDYVLHSLNAMATWQVLPALRLKAMFRSRIYSEERAGYTASHLVSGSLQWNVEGERRSSGSWRRRGLLAEVQGTWFDAPDYNARLYLSERSLRYGFLMPMLQGRGIRLTALLRLRLPWNLTAEAKYALTNYDGVAHIGSGLQQIDGNSRHELWVQVTHRF